METLDVQIREMIHKQQVLEYLKASGRNMEAFSDGYAEKIIVQCRQGFGPVKRLQKILARLVIVCILLSSLLGAAFVFLPVSFWDTPDGTQYPVKRAEAAMESGDYDTARAILSEEMAKSPNNGYYLIYYAELCQREGRHDEAATVLIDFLNNMIGTQNIQDGNGLYMKLKELTGPFSPDVEKAYQECMVACEESVENFAYLKALIENENYKRALRFCDSMKREGAVDNYLYTYYFTCYMHLEKYEECAVYFLSLADKWEEGEEEDFLFRLPFKGFICNNLNELKPYVSENTQKKIDDACLRLENN